MSATHHVVPRRIYFTVFALLMLLTFVTVEASQRDLGHWGLTVALLIACIKATMVMLWFMHVKYSSRLVPLALTAGFVWFLLLIGVVFADYLSRGWVPYPGK